MAISLPQSQGLPFGSEMSDAEEPPLAKVQEEYQPAAGQSGGVNHAGRESARQFGVPLDRPRREGILPCTQLRWSAPERQLCDCQASDGQAFDRWWTEGQPSDNWWPVLQLQTSTTSEDRLTVLEGMMMDVRNYLQARCMTAWGTRRVDNLEADGPLTRRGARTPELQPTEPIPCEIEGVPAVFLELDSDPGAMWLVATSTPQERDNMGSGCLRWDFQYRRFLSF